MFDIKAFLQSYISALCGSVVQLPKREPVELFLYGTPSESGNIGLRFGDSVVLYDGAVLPPIPNEVMAYQFVRLFNFTTSFTAHGAIGCNTTPETQEVTVGGLFPETYVANGYFTDVTYLYALVTNNDYGWAMLDSGAEIDSNYTDIRNIKWANYDVLNLDGSVYLAASEPIPVGEIVDYINEIPIYEVI